MARDAGFYKDDRRFLIACDDQFAPAQYFDFLAIDRVQVVVVPAKDGKSSANHVLDNLLKSDDGAFDERWLVLDVDRYDQGTHLKGYRETLQMARDNNVNLALSKPCFELWLLLHHLDESQVSELTDCDAVIGALKRHLGHYNKTRLTFGQFPLRSVEGAIERSRRLDRDDSLIPTANTTRVYRLWDSITRNLDPWRLLLSLEEHAQNGLRCDMFLGLWWCAPHPLSFIATNAPHPRVVRFLGLYEEKPRRRSRHSLPHQHPQLLRPQRLRSSGRTHEKGVRSLR